MFGYIYNVITERSISGNIAVRLLFCIAILCLGPLASIAHTEVITIPGLELQAPEHRLYSRNATNGTVTITTENVLVCNEDALYYVDYNATLSDPVNDTITWSVDTDAPFLSLNALTGVISGTPNNDEVGLYIINITATTDKGERNNSLFYLEVLNTNDAPYININDKTTCVEGEQYSANYKAVDEDPTGDTMTWALSTNADFLSMATSNGQLRGVPDDADVGSRWVNVSVSDGRGGRDFTNFTLTIQNVNDPPRPISKWSDYAMIEDTVDYGLTIDELIIDPDGPEMRSWFEGNTNIKVLILDNGTVRFTPDHDWNGEETIAFFVNDSLSETTFFINVTVTPINDPPIDLAIGLKLKQFPANTPQIATGSATDADLPYGDVLIFAWYLDKTDFLGEGDNWTLNLPAGNHLLTLNVTDGRGVSAEVSLNITSVGDAPDDDIDDDVVDDDTSDDGLSWMWYMAITGAMFVVVIIIIIVIVLIRRKKTRNEATQGGKDVAVEVESNTIFEDNQKKKLEAMGYTGARGQTRLIEISSTGTRSRPEAIVPEIVTDEKPKDEISKVEVTIPRMDIPKDEPATVTDTGVQAQSSSADVVGGAGEKGPEAPVEEPAPKKKNASDIKHDGANDVDDKAEENKGSNEEMTMLSIDD